MPLWRYEIEEAFLLMSPVKWKEIKITDTIKNIHLMMLIITFINENFFGC